MELALLILLTDFVLDFDAGEASIAATQVWSKTVPEQGILNEPTTKLTATPAIERPRSQSCEDEEKVEGEQYIRQSIEGSVLDMYGMRHLASSTISEVYNAAEQRSRRRSLWRGC